MNYFPQSKRAFTLVELLVTVAIIVILIAILVPALSEALYQATLAECRGNMDGFGMASITYAHGNKDSYPHRKVYFPVEKVSYSQGGLQPFLTINGQDPTAVDVEALGPSGVMGLLKYSPENDEWGNAAIEDVDADDRPLWQTIVDVSKTFVDPFADDLDLRVRAQTEEENSYDANDLVSSTFDILINWNWAAEGRIAKLGSKTTFEAPNEGDQLFTWDILMMDRDIETANYYEFQAGVSFALNTSSDWEQAFTSHPDHEGNMQAVVLKNAEMEEDTATNSRRFWVTQFEGRGPRDSQMDRNFLRADGSVQTLQDVYARRGMMATDTAYSFYVGNGWQAEDERMIVVPLDRGGDFTKGTSLMPRK